MTATIKLSNEELELIRLKREEEEANAAEAKRIAEEKRAAEQKAWEAEQLHKLSTEHMKKVDKANELINTDTEGLLNITWVVSKKTGVKLPCISYTAGGREYTIDIEEHVVSTGTSRRYSNKSNGLKFRMTAGIDDYNRKWIKNPATVLKNVRDFIKIADSRATAANSVLEQLTKWFPNNTIDHIAKGNNNKYYDTWTVNSDRGVVVYKANSVDGVITPKVIEVRPTSTLLDEVAALILND